MHGITNKTPITFIIILSIEQGEKEKERNSDSGSQENIVVKTENNREKFSEPLELPVFSTGVKNALTEGKSAEVWGQMLDELVMFYSRRYPSRLNCSEDYQIVGRMLYSAYPTIGRFGTHKWVKFIFIIT